MALAYNAYLELVFKNSSNQERRWKLPISFFSVYGGANREVSLRNGNDVSITSEMEQARIHKNLRLGMPPLPGAKAMEVTIDLIDAATNKSEVYVSFCVFKYKDGKGIEGLHLQNWDAKISGQPEVWKGFLTFQIALKGDINLNRLMYNPGQKTKAFQM